MTLGGKPAKRPAEKPRRTVPFVLLSYSEYRTFMHC